MSDLRIDKVTVHHEGRALVEATDIVVAAGRPLTLVGESGSGKSLLAHAVMGTLAPELQVAGSMTLAGTTFDLADRDNRRHLWGSSLALLPQEPALALDPTMKVRNQVAEGVPGFGWRDEEARRKADTALAAHGLEGVGASYPHTLSGGMAQRVAHAAATIGGAEVLIVDEPSKGLDPVAVDRLAALLTEHARGGGLLVTITHDLRLARALGGDVLVMQDATVLERGPVADVLAAPEHSYTRRLLAAEPAQWNHPWRASGGRSAERLLAAESIGKSYGDNVLFADLSLEIRAGERWAVCGPSGVGKTTLGNALTGLTSVDRGTITRSAALAAGKVQKLYQDPELSFPPRVTLRRAFADVLRRYDVPTGRLLALLEEVGLDSAFLERLPRQLSGGELQRLAVVRAMLPRPALLFADEATSRLDLLTQETTANCLMTEIAANDCALLVVTHDADLAAALSQHRIELEPGRPPTLTQ